MKKKSVPAGAALIASAVPIAPVSAIADRNADVIPEMTARSRNKLREKRRATPFFFGIFRIYILFRKLGVWDTIGTVLN